MMLTAVCGAQNVMRLPASDDVKTADFFVAAGNSGILIESKRTLGSAWDKSILAPESVVAIWQKLHGAYAQCADIGQRKQWKTDPRFAHIDNVVSVVVMDDVLVADGAASTHLMRAGGILAGMGLQKVESLSLADLDDALLRYGPVGFTALVEEKWNSGNEDEPFYQYMAVRPVERPFALRTFLADADAELFGKYGLKNIGYLPS
jgi:hypothetical protein